MKNMHVVLTGGMSGGISILQTADQSYRGHLNQVEAILRLANHPFSPCRRSLLREFHFVQLAPFELKWYSFLHQLLQAMELIGQQLNQPMEISKSVLNHFELATHSHHVVVSSEPRKKETQFLLPLLLLHEHELLQ